MEDGRRVRETAEEARSRPAQASRAPREPGSQAPRLPGLQGEAGGALSHVGLTIT